MKFVRVPILLLLVILAACSLGDDDTSDQEWGASSSPPERNSQSSASSPAAPETPPAAVETKNVTYVGLVRPAGISVYTEGTHRLILPEDEFVLLETVDVDLNGYVGEKAEVFGAVRPTNDGNGMIMRVERIRLVDSDSTEPETSDDDADTLEPTTENESDDVLEVEDTKDSPADELVEEQAEEVLLEQPIDEEQSDPEAYEEVPLVLSEELNAIIDSMARDTYTADRWTQDPYCSSHIGFCIPIHRNWWYNSFGNTSNHLWHVELSNQEIENLGDGPVVVKLVAGSVGSKRATDGQVRVESDRAVGYRAWDSSRHFEVVADARLEPAVRYLTQGLERLQEAAE